MIIQTSWRNVGWSEPEYRQRISKELDADMPIRTLIREEALRSQNADNLFIPCNTCSMLSDGVSVWQIFTQTMKLFPLASVSLPPGNF